MSIKIIITLVMIAAIVFLTLKNWAHHTIVMAGVPIVAALLMGFDLNAVTKMTLSGLNTDVMTTAMMIFSLAYF